MLLLATLSAYAHGAEAKWMASVEVATNQKRQQSKWAVVKK